MNLTLIEEFENSLLNRFKETTSKDFEETAEYTRITKC